MAGSKHKSNAEIMVRRRSYPIYLLGQSRSIGAGDSGNNAQTGQESNGMSHIDTQPSEYTRLLVNREEAVEVAPGPKYTQLPRLMTLLQWLATSIL